MADIWIWHTAYGPANDNARGAFQERFLNRYLPGHRMLANLHRRLRKHGCFNENSRGFGRLRELGGAVEEDLLQYFRDNPHASTRAAECDLKIWNHFNVWHGLKNNHLHPYHLKKLQDLLPTNYLPHEHFALWCNRKMGMFWSMVSSLTKPVSHTQERLTHITSTTGNRITLM